MPAASLFSSLSVSGLQRKKSSQYRGVVLKGKSYVAQITVDGQQIHLGRFENPADAARRYDQHAKKAFGVKAKLNFPPVSKANKALPVEASHSDADSSPNGMNGTMNGHSCRSQSRKRRRTKDRGGSRMNGDDAGAADDAGRSRGSLGGAREGDGSRRSGRKVSRNGMHAHGYRDLEDDGGNDSPGYSKHYHKKESSKDRNRRHRRQEGARYLGDLLETSHRLVRQMRERELSAFPPCPLPRLLFGCCLLGLPPNISPLPWCDALWQSQPPRKSCSWTRCSRAAVETCCRRCGKPC